MKAKAQIFSPDVVKTRLCQAIMRDMQTPLHEYGVKQGSTALLRQRQLLELEKKYKSFSTSDDSPRTLAFIKFLNVNEHMQDYSAAGLDLPDRAYVRPQPTYPPRVNILLRARAIVSSVLSAFTEDEWFQCCKHGTGSSLGVSYQDTSLEAKSSWPITVSSRALPIFKRYLEFDRSLNSALCYFNRTNPTQEWYKLEIGSRATTVPKNDTIDRCISVEPTANMFLQQGLMVMMYRRMKYHGLDLATLPTQHQERARLASINGREATIDWSSASDCLSIDLLRWLIPPQWFDCCDLVRSSVTDQDGHIIRLNMFSTMGNAVTFPLETLVFWSFAHACRLEIQGRNTFFPEWEDRLVCSVFGDDCIVPVEVAPLFIEMMQTLGFICNEKKTFIENTGFRESCGGDFLHGHDVRPFNLKGPHNVKLSSLEPWLYIIANRLIPKYILCFGERDYVYEKAFFEEWFGIFEEYKLKLKLVPPHYPDDSGLSVNDDILRLIRYYRGEISRVGVDQHGSHQFLYSRFQYRKDRQRFDWFHYNAWLKNPGGERSVWWEEKKIGGYVVAKGRSGHWSLPVIYR